MYFPYLRGRQYELLALRELADSTCLGSNIIPIIEPVKISSTFLSTLDSFVRNGKEIAVILNPHVGSFSKDLDNDKNITVKVRYKALLQNELIIKAHIINDLSHAELEQLESNGFEKKDLLIVSNNRDYIDLYSKEFATLRPRYTLMPDESEFRRKIKKDRVLLDDKFEKQNRNTDYANVDDVPFSDDHLFYKDDDFIGFSDYSIVGNHFLEAGFAPYAVALHIVYFADDKSLRIKHFVSDTNADITNPAGKFYEALKKLNTWDRAHNMNTLGLTGLLNHFKNETYPGLGTVKKLSMMHHIQLVGQYLDEVD